MRNRLLAVGAAAMLALVLTAPAAATTTRIPFHILSSAVIGFEDATVTFVGNSMHANGMVLVMEQDADVDMLDGVLTVRVNYLFAGKLGDNLWGTETLESSLYPGEGFNCTLHGGWDADGRHVYDHCFGYGEHLGGWQFASHTVSQLDVNVAFTGDVWNPGQ